MLIELSKIIYCMGFPGGSDGKESASNAEDLGCEDTLEKDMVTHSSILAWRIHIDYWRATVHGGHKESDTTEQLSMHIHLLHTSYVKSLCWG